MPSKGKQLVIVESPAKARSIGRYLGSGYDVQASIGHVRDLPPKKMGVDVEEGFEPEWKIIRGKGKVIKDLKKRAKGAESVILATDPDREGEAIAWHLAEELGYEKARDRFKRVTFREITKKAVQEAMDHPGDIDDRKVDAQVARRILDRLVGYSASPFLWKPIRPGLSAGRVQTVALRLIAEREEAIRAFDAEEYWSIEARLEKDGQEFEARLHQIQGKSFKLRNAEQAQAVVDDVAEVPWGITELKRRERRKNPSAPFTTSTLQQEAAKRLRFSARRTMSNAQRLYEGQEIGGRGTIGLITYMRTDSTRVSAGAVQAARKWIDSEYGDGYTPSSPRMYGGKSQKAAQEAHEAIRPTDPTLHPDEARKYLEKDQADLYEVIWLRFVSSQMSPALYDTTTVDFHLVGKSGKHNLFRSTGSIMKFDGFTRLYTEAREEGDHRRLDDVDPLPEMEEREEAAELLAALDPQMGAELLHELPDDDAADLVAELGAREANQILANLSMEEAGDLRGLLLYEEDSAGGIMTTELVALRGELTAEAALNEIRRQAREVVDFYTVFVVDDGNRLLGTVPLADLVAAPTDQPVVELAQEVPVTVLPDTDQEEVGRLMSRYNLVSAPVVNEFGQLMGRITFDDIIDVIEAEQTEDILRLAGMSEEEEVRSDWRDAVRSRLPWLALNLVTITVASSVVILFEGTIQRFWYLAMLLPIVGGMGGNSGTQALAVTIRRIALASSELERRSDAVSKELLVGLVNGLALGVFAALAVWFLGTRVVGIPSALPVVVLVALWCNVLLAGFAGAFIPTLLDRLGVDPAVASSVFLTTFTDLVGFALLLGLASVLLI